jgi:hypothetical protein
MTERTEQESEVLVSLSMRFPAVDRRVLNEHLAPVVEAALKAGGIGTNFSIQPYDPDEDEL